MAVFYFKCVHDDFFKSFKPQHISQCCQFNNTDGVWNVACSTIDMAQCEMNSIVRKPGRSMKHLYLTSVKQFTFSINPYIYINDSNIHLSLVWVPKSNAF